MFNIQIISFIIGSNEVLGENKAGFKKKLKQNVALWVWLPFFKANRYFCVEWDTKPRQSWKQEVIAFSRKHSYWCPLTGFQFMRSQPEFLKSPVVPIGILLYFLLISLWKGHGVPFLMAHNVSPRKYVRVSLNILAISQHVAAKSTFLSQI